MPATLFTTINFEHTIYYDWDRRWSRREREGARNSLKWDRPQEYLLTACHFATWVLELFSRLRHAAYLVGIDGYFNYPLLYPLT